MSIDYKARHNAALLATPLKAGTNPHESAIVAMLKGWQMYANAHKARFESDIGSDYVLGPEWQAIGEALRGLLNGETGRIDCGTMDRTLLDTLAANGIDTSKL